MRALFCLNGNEGSLRVMKLNILSGGQGPAVPLIK